MHFGASLKTQTILKVFPNVESIPEKLIVSLISEHFRWWILKLILVEKRILKMLAHSGFCRVFCCRNYLQHQEVV